MAVRVTQLIPQVGESPNGTQNLRVSQFVREVGEDSATIQNLRVSQFVVEIGYPVVEPVTFSSATVNMPLTS
jgi:hypothetical protein